MTHGVIVHHLGVPVGVEGGKVAGLEPAGSIILGAIAPVPLGAQGVQTLL